LIVFIELSILHIRIDLATLYIPVKTAEISIFVKLITILDASKRQDNRIWGLYIISKTVVLGEA